MNQKEYSVESRLRVEEQLTELIEKHGLDNVRETFSSLIPNFVADKYEGQAKALNTTKKQTNPVTVNENNDKLTARASVRNFNDYILGLNKIQQSGKAQISKPIIDYLNSFLNNAKLIFEGKYKEVGEAFYMSLAARVDFDLKNEDEEWIIYNLEIIVKQLKNKLRRIGYVFLDNDAEVGQLFNSKIHNCVKFIETDESIKDGRIIRVIDEGIIIEGILHINANVAVGRLR
jgi:hypothetical protein